MDLSSGSAGVLALWAAIGYGLGSIPFGLILAKAMNLGDLRKIGSGNIGATNVLRTGNKLAAALTLLLDGGKGAVAVLIALAYSGESAAQLAALAAFLGHCYPVWLMVVLAVLIYWRHRANIARLRAGSETKIGQKG